MGLSMGINRPKQIIGQATGPTIWTGNYSYITPATAAPPNMGEIVHGDNVLSQMLFAKTDINGVAYTGTKLAIGDILVIGGTQYVLDAAPVEYPTYYGVYIEPETQKQDGVYPVTVYAGGAQPPAFNPIDLFAAGEQGAWYDPSDFSTMFQDSAGTTPVTADGQPVGLILDKSRGLALGLELVTNGDFNNGTTGWVAESGAVLTTDSGGIRVTNGAAQPSGATQEFATVAGRTYKASVNLLGYGGGASDGQLRVGTFSNDFSLGYVSSSAIAPIVLYFTATGTITHVSVVGRTTTIGAYGIYDSVSVKELAGNHATQATAASRPILRQDANFKYYLEFDGVDDSLSTAAIDFTSTYKMSMFSGVYNNNDSVGTVLQLSSVESDPGSLFLRAPGHAASTYGFAATGSVAQLSILTPASYPSPALSVLYAGYDLFPDNGVISYKVNSSAETTVNTVTTGTSVFANRPLYIGSRSSSIFLNGRIYSLIVRGALSTTQEITDTEQWVAEKTGVTLP